MLLSEVNVNAMLENDQAAVIKIDNVWYLVARIENQTKYFYSVLLVNGDIMKLETLQRDHAVIVITPDDLTAYNIQA